MSNDDYRNFKPMLLKIVSRYIPNRFGLEKDDLISIGTLGMVQGFASYDENKHTHSFVTHIWKRIDFEIRKELHKLSKKQKDYILVSIEAPAGCDDICIADTLESDINVIESVHDSVFISFATKEFRKSLQDPQAVDIIRRYVFSDNSIEYLALKFNISHEEMAKLIRQYRDKLRRNLRFRKLHIEAMDNRMKYNISEYVAAERAAIDKLNMEYAINRFNEKKHTDKMQMLLERLAM